MPQPASLALLAAESTVREGDVPKTIPGTLKEMPTFAIARDAFLLRLPSGLRFHYRQGNGVTYARPDHVTDPEVSLFLNGSVYGAIAWINGLVPLHASAVVHDGRAHAFSAHSGAGKSTLAAALGARGFPLLADDVLVLDLSDPGQVMCLPGHKQLKLWHDAVALTGAAPGAQVRPDLDKYYTAPPGGHHPAPVPLSDLYFLEDNAKSGCNVAPVSGTASFTLARTAFYRPHFCAAVTDSRDLFAILSRIATQVRIARFDRPRRKELFEEGVSAMVGAIRDR